MDYKIDERLIREINEKTPILDLASEFVSLSKRGKNYMGLCPFHDEKTPSFSVSPEKNIAKCMSCGEGGTPINFYRKIKNISFNEAAEILAERAGIKLKTKTKRDAFEQDYLLLEEAANFYKFNLFNSEKGNEALDYLYKRGLSKETIEHYNIGYAPIFGDTLYRVLKDKKFLETDMLKLGLIKKREDSTYFDLFSDRIIFPITNPQGKTVGFSGRALSENEKVKYINSPETNVFKKGQLLYHFNEALGEIRKAKNVILFEGFFDVISAYQADLKQGVAAMGTALTQSHAKLIKQASDSVIIAYDGDNAGIEASMAAIKILEKENLKIEVLAIPDGLDPDDFIKDYGEEQFLNLFGEYLKDSYDFQYNVYKKNKNLANANDILSFEKEIKRMLINANPTIKNIYNKRLAKDLNIDIAEIARHKIKDIKRKSTTNKYERAEQILIVMMLKLKKYSDYVKEDLKTTDFANHIAASIRAKIIHYYIDHEELIIDDFVNNLPKEEREYLVEKIINNVFYKNFNEELLTNEEVDDYITLVKQAGLNRRIDFLANKIKENPSNTKLLKEYNDIMRQLKK